ncbi:oxidoreductase [Arsenicicoccus piscis]|uniref:Short-chain dehydrogenase n=1 Tax=Arsenicicoccus piscis TaxID=673954 RepID=A0ABQ6HV92_9MICO|nr:oxidoreductase [Arsenicicoccus piscis]GMA21887.1 short-chain dehydrogenase [Arsenicicoccus piscis]
MPRSLSLPAIPRPTLPAPQPTEQWTADDIPDLAGRTYVVTGATSGIGFATARELATHGAHVVLAVRDTERGAEAAEQMTGGTGSTAVGHLDLADLSSVAAFAEALPGLLGSDAGSITGLVNNAGIMAVAQATSVDGFESQFATNVLGHFLLTNLLLPRITDRVVTLSSTMHRMGRLDLADLGFSKRRYTPWAAYNQSKLADLVFAYELQRRLTGAGSTLRSMAAHPGYASTNLQRRSAGWQAGVMDWANRKTPLAQSADAGALPTLYATTVPDLPGGSYVGPGGFGEMAGSPRTVGSSPVSHDRRLGRELWAACETMTGRPFVV